jgi:maltose alpha-D-glucosyltransferase/alpha-amylase
MTMHEDRTSFGKVGTVSPDRSSQLTVRLEENNGDALARYIRRQRWFGGKGRSIAGVHLLEAATLPHSSPPVVFTLIEVTYDNRDHEMYALPLVIREEGLEAQGQAVEARTDKARDADAGLMTIQTPTRPHVVSDSAKDEAASLALLAAIRSRAEWAGEAGQFTAWMTHEGEQALAEPVAHARLLSGEQSNSSIVFDGRFILKVIRKVEPGLNPDFELLEFLTTRTTYRHVPRILGHLTYVARPAPAVTPAPPVTMAVLQPFIPNHGDGWEFAQRHVQDLLAPARRAGSSAGPQAAKVVVQSHSDGFLKDMRHLGDITGALHVALASDDSRSAFRPEPITDDDCARWRLGMERNLRAVLGELASSPREANQPPYLAPETVEELVCACLTRLDALAGLARTGVLKIRHHGDYHLGQVLKTNEGFVILDFEGEPARPLEERRRKVCALKDAAGMLRSFDYAAQAGLKRLENPEPGDRALAEAWTTLAAESFLAGYFDSARPGEAGFLPATRGEALDIVRVFALDKVIYELRYELRNRPDWLDIPLHGLQRLLRAGAMDL